MYHVTQEESIVFEADLGLSVGVSHDGIRRWFRHAMTNDGGTKDPSQIVLVHLTARTSYHPEKKQSNSFTKE